jgi:hypothetical protein
MGAKVPHAAAAGASVCAIAGEAISNAATAAPNKSFIPFAPLCHSCFAGDVLGKPGENAMITSSR